jgi:hypothetical protein
MVWVTGWTNLPFGGLNRPVNTITKSLNETIVFAGAFSKVEVVSNDTQLLNGLYEYNLEDLYGVERSSPITQAGLLLNNGAIRNEIIVYTNRLYISSKFSSRSEQTSLHAGNLIVLNNARQAEPLLGNGMNRAVTNLLL